MKRLVVLALIIAAFGVTTLQGCGDDADDDSPTDAGSAGKGGSGGGGGRGGAGGRSGAGTSGGGSGSSGTDVKCGSATCTSPGGMFGGFATACCADTATSTCGMSVMGAPCAKPATGDPRCPGLTVMGAIMLPSCCTMGLCGIDASMFGMPGCVDLKTAAERSSMMGGSGTMIPAPRACDAADAGAADAGI